MAHFLKPPGVAADGYDVDNKLAPGSIWRVRIPLGARRKVALWSGDGLKVRSNNPGVVPNEDNDAVRDVGRSGDLRLFELFGRSEGTSLIDVWGADGNFWLSIQARIETKGSTIQFGGPNNSTQESGDAQYEKNPQGTLVRITIPVKRSAYLNLLGLPPVDLKVAANDPSIVSCDVESSSGSASRPIRITGLKMGNAMIEAKNGQGVVLAFVQLEVRPGIDFGSGHHATQVADYSNVDIDAFVADMKGPTPAVGILSKGYCRWLEIRPPGLLIDALGPVPGKAVSMSYPKIVYESMPKRVIVVRQGWSIRTGSGEIRDEFLEIWWRTADDTEHKGVLSWCRDSEHGNQLAYAMMVRPAAGDSVLFQMMKEDMARAVVGVAIDAAGAGLTRSWKPGAASRPAIPKLNVPRAVPMQRGRYAANPPLDPKLTELARDARATQAGVSRERFESINIATARVRVNGKIEYLDAGNLPGKDFGASRGIDSEQWLIVQVQEWRKQGKNVVVEQLYSERIPCTDCQNKMDNEFKEASIYYTVPEMRGSRADALMRAYGLDPAQVE
jgi:hypothetical protein